MQTPPGEALPGTVPPIVNSPEAQAKIEALANMTGGRMNTLQDLTDAARGRNDLINKTLTQSLYNRGGKFAKFSDFMARFMALFKPPSENRDRSGTLIRRGRSAAALAEAITGRPATDMLVSAVERRERAADAPPPPVRTGGNDVPLPPPPPPAPVA